MVVLIELCCDGYSGEDEAIKALLQVVIPLLGNAIHEDLRSKSADMLTKMVSKSGMPDVSSHSLPVNVANMPHWRGSHLAGSALSPIKEERPEDLLEGAKDDITELEEVDY